MKKNVVVISIIIVFSSISFANQSNQELYELGKKYHEGLGVKKDINKALEYYKAAAGKEFDYAPAIYQLGMIFYKGDGVERNLDIAGNALGLACNLGFIPALIASGDILLEIDEPVLAKKKYVEAVNKGSVEALYKIGILHLDKKDENNNLETALEYLEKAVNKNYQKAFSAYGSACYIKGLQYIQSENIEKNYEIIEYWMNQAEKYGVESGNETLAEKYYDIGYSYATNENKINIEKTKIWFAKAAQKGHNKAAKALELAKQYENKAKRQSSGNTSGSSLSGRCSDYATLIFESSGETFTGTCSGSRSIQITSLPQGVNIDRNDDKSLVVNGYFNSSRCIRGKYSFTYTAKAGMACDKRVTYSGSFYLDGKNETYNIFLSGNMITVNGY